MVINRYREEHSFDSQEYFEMVFLRIQFDYLPEV